MKKVWEVINYILMALVALIVAPILSLLRQRIPDSEIRARILDVVGQGPVDLAQIRSEVSRPYSEFSYAQFEEILKTLVVRKVIHKDLNGIYTLAEAGKQEKQR